MFFFSFYLTRYIIITGFVRKSVKSYRRTVQAIVSR